MSNQCFIYGGVPFINVWSSLCNLVVYYYAIMHLSMLTPSDGFGPGRGFWHFPPPGQSNWSKSPPGGWERCSIVLQSLQGSPKSDRVCLPRYTDKTKWKRYAICDLSGFAIPVRQETIDHDVQSRVIYESGASARPINKLHVVVEWSQMTKRLRFLVANYIAYITSKTIANTWAR